MKLDLRNANIGIAVGTVLLFVGGYLLRGAGEGPLEVLALTALVAALGTAEFLNERDERRHKRDQ
jgi:hypothetical protein